MALTKFVDAPKFEEYKEKYKEHFIMERRNGVIMLRMHTQGKSVKWTVEIHRAIQQALREVGADPENEVLILTGTGDYWIAHLGEAAKDTDIDESTEKMKQWASYNFMYADGTKIQDNLIFDIEIPTIGALNGPGFHSEMAFLCDLTICTEDSVLIDVHYKAGLVPGDGIHCALQGLLGPKRANYIMLMGEPITAKMALEWGLVNEIVPKKKIYDRAWEMGEQLMKASRIQRRMTTQIIRKPWKQRLAEDLHGGFAMEMFAYNVEEATHDPKFGNMLFENAGVKLKKWEDL